MVTAWIADVPVLKVSFWGITKLQHSLIYVKPTHSFTSKQFIKKS